MTSIFIGKVLDQRLQDIVDEVNVSYEYNDVEVSDEDFQEIVMVALASLWTRKGFDKQLGYEGVRGKGDAIHYLTALINEEEKAEAKVRSNNLLASSPISGF